MARQQAGENTSPDGTDGGEAQEDQASSANAGAADLDKVRVELADAKDKYVRLMADFENFKKRALKEQSELLKYQGERLVVDLLEVLDNLELALAHSSAEYDKLKAGLEMTHKLFVEKLGRWEIRGESGMGKVFDPQRHQAISRVTSPDAEPNQIVGELKKAYSYKDKLIRVGEVVVAVAPEESGT